MKKFQINPAYEARAYWIIIAMVTLVFLFSMGMNAQVVRKGNTFIEQDTKTQYLYTDSKGITDTVYLSKNGSAFVWKVSKKTGKKYRKYKGHHHQLVARDNTNRHSVLHRLNHKSDDHF